MPKLDGLAAGRHLRKTHPEITLVFLTVHEDPNLAAECLKMGASGYLLKGSAAAELFEAIRGAVEGKAYVTPLPATATGGTRETRGNALTPRQREVVALLADGLSMRQAAERLGVTPRTIAFHKYRVMHEHRLGSNAELVQFAIRRGIVTV
jgi:DNA-binding NarL/FixJ family response regulator